MANLEVAKTILEQLGGRRFQVMTGARNFVGSADTLSFRLPKAKDGINCVRVRLTPLDVYEVQFIRTRGTTATLVKTFEDVYCDLLQDVFFTATGLYTSL